jgi:hypothetical protein
VNFDTQVGFAPGWLTGTVHAEGLPGVIEISHARCEDSMGTASMWTHMPKDIIKSPAIGDKRKVDALLCPLVTSLPALVQNQATFLGITKWASGTHLS